MTIEGPMVGTPFPLPRTHMHSALTQMSAGMFAEAFRLRYGQRPLEKLLLPIARRFAGDVITFHELAAHDLKRPSQWVVEQLCSDLTVNGAENLPHSGPLIVTCNHPGVMDAMAVFASLPRTDTKVIARTRNLLDVLPNIRQHIIFVAEEHSQHVATLRQAIAHLQNGGTIVTFPAGEIEPDPQLYSQSAQDFTKNWSKSVALLARQVPGTIIVPAAIGGVIAERARETWLARRYHKPATRDWVAATLQFMFKRYRDAHPTLYFGQPIASADDRTALHAVILEQTKGLMAHFE
ncbi:MAG: 1-acyl-sn-glycerol-3-phosphate acyltransferase [Anaerolineae bacterium]|nr:1-acyl-sn-glycerol-3-phosphate acyltransferase [Anaerolineae bacterium]